MSSDAQYHDFLKLRKATENKFCLFFECKNPAIEAHSIQKERILSKLSVNGEVVVFEHKDKVFTHVQKGKRKATTFTGFCSEHDNCVFQEIERNDYKEGNLKQETLFAYRALVTEYHAKKSAISFFTALLFDIHSVNGVDLNKEYLQLALAGEQLGSKDIERCLDFFRIMFESENFSELITKKIILDDECGLAISSAITFPFDFEGNQLDHLTIELEKPSLPLLVSIFPQRGKTFILMSFLKEGESMYYFLDDQLFKKDQKTKKKLLSNLILKNCSNIVFSPKIWDKLSRRKKDQFIDMFTPNMLEDFNPDFAKNIPPFDFFTPLP